MHEKCAKMRKKNQLLNREKTKFISKSNLVSE